MSTTQPPLAMRAERKLPVSAIAAHPDRIDVRSPAEYVDDHLPGAESHPVLNNEERARIGTLHAQVSEFAAKRAGAALVARNIADMLETSFAARPREWAPLVYCWRGGKRSGALAHMLNEIGWKAVQLDGGYRAYRRQVLSRLTELPQQFRYHVICGLTGSGKSRLLSALSESGAQVLDLEGLARHRGSLLGDYPDAAQPSQKWFESVVLDALDGFDPARCVYVESESRRIGSVQVPDALLAAMRAADCINVETPQPLRVALLKDEYAHYLADPAALNERLARLTEIHGRKTIARWADAAAAGDWDLLVAELLAQHYDPTYAQAIGRNFPRASEARPVAPEGVGSSDFRTLADRLIAEEESGR
jgi:tRNA 2-selenouridine synthase